MAGHKRPVLDEQTKGVVRAFGSHWYLDEKTGNVQIRFVDGLPELLSFLWKNGFCHKHIFHEDQFATARKRKSADFLIYAEEEPGTTARAEDKSFVEILHPALNRFIKESILSVAPKTPAVHQ